MNKKRIIYISGTRADYGLMRNFLLNLNKIPEIQLDIIATGMHLSYNFGYTLQNIINDGLNVYRIYSNIDGGDLLAMTQSVGFGIIGIAQKIDELKPDLVIIEGDRYEALAGAIAASHQNIPIVHQGGGDIGSSIDNKIRFAITALSDYHFVGNPESYNRLIKMGYKNVFNFGEPGLDDIYENNFFKNENKILNKYNLKGKKYIIAIFHPNTYEFNQLKDILKGYIGSLKNLAKKYKILVIGSNSDAGGILINNELSNIKNIKFILSIEREEFLTLMKNCYFMIGNSSSAIVELPSFKKFAVNIGTRQEGRLRANNIIDVGYDYNDILKGIEIVEKKIKNGEEKNIVNPYYNGGFTKQAIKKILEILKIK